MSSKQTPDIYVYSEPIKGAMDINVVVCHLTKPLKHVKASLDVTDAAAYLEELQESHGLEYTHDVAKVSNINIAGYHSAVQQIIELLIPTHIWRYGLKNCNLYRIRGVPPSYYYKTVIAKEKQRPALVVPKYICQVKRHWWAVNVWHGLYPQYDWDKNLGMFNVEHAIKVLLAKEVSGEHYLDFITYIPKIWINEVKKFNLDILTEADYLNSREDNIAAWWCEICKKKSFVDGLPLDTQLEMARLTSGLYPDIAFRRYLKKELKTYVPAFNTSHLRATVRRSMFQTTTGTTTIETAVKNRHIILLGDSV